MNEITGITDLGDEQEREWGSWLSSREVGSSSECWDWVLNRSLLRLVRILAGLQTSQQSESVAERKKERVRNIQRRRRKQRAYDETEVDVDFRMFGSSVSLDSSLSLSPSLASRICTSTTLSSRIRRTKEMGHEIKKIIIKSSETSGFHFSVETKNDTDTEKGQESFLF